MKFQEKQNAINLRKEGMSMRDIAKLLNVSRSSVSIWVRDVKLTEQQHIELFRKNPAYNKQRLGQIKMSEIWRNKRLLCQEQGKIQAKKNDLYHIAGCMLYWAEGAKDRTTLTFSNTNPDMVLYFVNFLRKFFNLENADFNIRINCYDNNNLSIDEIQNFWLKKLALPKEALRKAIVNNAPRSRTGQPKNGKHPYGICMLRISCGMKVVQHIFGALQVYANLPADFGLE